LYDAIAAQAGTRDIYRLLRTQVREVPLPEAVRALGDLRRRIVDAPAVGRLHGRVIAAGDQATLDDAVRALGSYHARPVIEREGDVLRVGDLELVFYYANRLSHLPAERVIARAGAK